MSKKDIFVQKGFLSLNIGDLSKAYKESYEQSQTGKTLSQEKAVSTVLELVYTDEGWIDVNSRDGNFFFTHRKRVFKQIRYELQVIPKGFIQKNFERRMLPNLTNEGQKHFLYRLQEMVENLPDQRDFMNLKQEISSPEKLLSSRFVEKCIWFCLCMPNTPGEIIKWENHNIAPDIHSKNDPYRLVSKDRGSTAVLLQVIISGPDGQTTEEPFHNFNDVTNLILQQGLIIDDIKFDKSTIKVSCIQQISPSCILRKLTREESRIAKDFVFRHEEEFRRKVSWGKRKLSEMIQNGLDTGKWSAYGYFDGGNLIAYLDNKLRIDGSVELGALLTEPKYRRYHLASSLIYFYKLLYPHCRVFGGTFEENDKMIKVFQTTGFSRILYYDRTTMQKAKTIRERIDPKHPNDPQKYTNSVYYFSESLVARAFSSKLD